MDEDQVVDFINHPPHYNQGGLEVMDISDAFQLDRYEHNIVKYVLRSKFKGQRLEDLMKARWYLDRLIRRI